MRSVALAAALCLASGCLTYQAAVKPDEPDPRVTTGFMIGEVGGGALLALAVQASGDEAGDDISFAPAFAVSMLAVFATDLFLMIVYQAAIAAST